MKAMLDRHNTSARRLVGLCLGLVVLAGACTSGDEQVTDAISSESAIGESTSESNEPDPAADTTTTSATTSTTTETTVSAADEEQALIDRLMAAHDAYWQAYVECIADTTTCDFDKTVAPVSASDARTQLRSAVESLVADGQSVRGLAVPHFYRRHGVLFESPATYALELCYESDGGTIFTVNDDGSEEIVSEEQSTEPTFRQVVLEESSDGALVVTDVVTSEETVEGEDCGEFKE